MSPVLIFEPVKSRSKSLVPMSSPGALLSVNLSLMATWTTTVWSKWASIFFSIAHRLKLRMALFWWTIQKTSLQRRPWNTSWIWFVLSDYLLNILFELRDDKEVCFSFFFGRPKQGVLKVLGIRCSLERKLILLRFV